MSAKSVLVSLLTAGVVVCGANLADAQLIRVRIAPPQLRVETQPEPEWGGAVWQPGHWRWNGRSWYWRRGRWLQPRGDGYYYSQARWIEQGGRWVYYSGGWRRHRPAAEASSRRVVVQEAPRRERFGRHDDRRSHRRDRGPIRAREARDQERRHSRGHDHRR